MRHTRFVFLIGMWASLLVAVALAQRPASGFGRRVIGSHGGETRPDDDIPRYLALSRLGKLRLSELITHRLPLEQINEAFTALLGGEVARQVIRFA